MYYAYYNCTTITINCVLYVYSCISWTLIHRTGRMRPQHFSFSVSLFASHEESKAQVLQPPQAVHAAELRGRRQVVVLDFEDGRRQPIRR